MPIIYSNITNEKYTVCCMGQMVYIYEKGGRELKRSILPGAEFAAISPAGDVFAVKTGEGCLALYSFEKLEQIKILVESCEKNGLENGMCFSCDGDKLYNVEGNAVAVYDMSGEKCEKFTFENTQLGHIECGEAVFVMGKEDGKCFVSKLEGGLLKDKKYISDKAFDLCVSYKCAEIRGYSSAAVEHYLPQICNVEEEKASIALLWKNEG